MFCHFIRTLASLRVSRYRYLAFVGALLAAGTIGLFRYAPVYLVGGPLEVPQVRKFAHADLGMGSETLRAGSEPRLGFAYREFSVTPGQAYFVRADLRAAGIEWRDDLDRNSGRLVFLFQRNGQPMHGLRHTVAELRQPYEWHSVDDFFQTPQDVSSAYVGLDLWAETGEIGIRNLEVCQATLGPWHRYGRPMLAIGWLLLLVVILRPVLIPTTFRLSQLVGPLTAIIIVVGATIPKPLLLRLKEVVITTVQDQSTVAQAVKEPTHSFMAPTGFTPLTKLQKLGHLVLFALLYCSLPRNYAFGISVSLAAITEFLQFFVSDREPSVLDFGIDCLGIAIGMAVIGCWRRFQHTRFVEKAPLCGKGGPTNAPTAL